MLPVLMGVLAKNRHHDYPQRIFEQGKVVLRKGEEVVEKDSLALVSCHSKAEFTEMKQYLNFLMASLGLSYELKHLQHQSFIKGRCGEIMVNSSIVGIIGEISPEVLVNFGLENPAAAVELNLSALLQKL